MKTKFRKAMLVLALFSLVAVALSACGKHVPPGQLKKQSAPGQNKR